MMQLRAEPGDAIEHAKDGMVIEIEKYGEVIAILGPPDTGLDTVIHSDGSISGNVPLTFRRDLGNGGYG